MGYKIQISRAEFIRLQKKFKTDEAIGKEFGVTRQRIHQIRIGYGIPFLKGKRAKRTAPPKKKIPAKDKVLKIRLNAKISKAELIELIEKFKTDAEIGKALGLTRGRICQLRVFYRLTTTWAQRKERNSKIIALLNNGASLQSIANKMRLSKRQIQKLLYFIKKK